MNRPQPQVRLFAAGTEAPLAYTALALATATVVWKTVGLEFLPGWDEMFGTVGAQYPRRVEALAPAWAVGYLLIYGVLGSVATLAGVMITRQRGALESPAGARVSRYAKLVGLFHVIIGLHHTLWAVTGGAWGHLTLEQFHAPGLYVAGAIGGCGAGLHGARLLVSSAATPTHRIVRSKIAVDGVSFLTFTSVLICFPMNAMGLDRHPNLERWSWIAVFVAPVLWLLMDWLHAKRQQA